VPESKARRRVIARLYCEEPQRCYWGREACIADENSLVMGMYYPSLQLESELAPPVVTHMLYRLDERTHRAPFQ